MRGCLWKAEGQEGGDRLKSDVCGPTCQWEAECNSVELVAYRYGQLPVWIDVHLCEPIDIDRLSGPRRIYYRVPVSELSGLPVSASKCNTLKLHVPVPSTRHP